MEKYLKNLKRYPKNRKTVKNLPEEAGVYVFWLNDKPIYIGKAKNLKRRVGSYFNLKLAPKTYQMVGSADSLSFIQVTSELESLLLEAHLIKSFQPHYNSQAKDDKHPLYIKITDEELPRVITVRKVDAFLDKKSKIYGPFPSSTNVRFVLRMLRKIFPFSDHKPGKRVCIEHHLGLCNPCPSEIVNEENLEIRHELIKHYKFNLRMVKSVLGRKFNIVNRELEKRMKNFSNNQMYEKAFEVKKRIEMLNYITQPIIPNEEFLKNPQLYEDVRQKELLALKKLLVEILPLNNLSRIECFDVAHLAGSSPTASMVTFVDGNSEKSLYRHFKVHPKKGNLQNNDVLSMREIISRRIKHLKDWGEPDLIIVDGGKTQSGAFFEALEKLEIPVIGLAKRFETIVIPFRNENKLDYKLIKIPEGPALNLMQRIRDEAHRFARRLHHKLISKSLLQR